FSPSNGNRHSRNIQTTPHETTTLQSFSPDGLRPRDHKLFVRGQRRIAAAVPGSFLLLARKFLVREPPERRGHEWRRAPGHRADGHRTNGYKRAALAVSMQGDIAARASGRGLFGFHHHQFSGP